MAKKQQEKQYIPSKEELESHLICTKEGIAYSISRAYPNEDARYYVERYEIKNYKKTQYIKIDKTKSESSLNRRKFKLYNAMELVFKLYCKSAKSILSSKEDSVSKEEKTIKKTNNKKQINSFVESKLKHKK